MKTSIRILLILLSGIILNLPLFAQDLAKKKVAVYMTGNEDSYKKVIGSKLVSAITATDEYAAVERTADFLAALTSEQDYQMSGEVRDSQIARLGQKFGVRYVVVADVSEIFDEIFISSRLINVETGLVEKAFDTSGYAENLNQLLNLSSKIAEGLFGNGINLSLYATEPIHLSLYAEIDNKRVFITKAQWASLPEEKREKFKKIGLCIVGVDCTNIVRKFVISLEDTGFGDWYAARRLSAPTLEEYGAMDHCRNVNEKAEINEINDALSLYGGTRFNNVYWTSSEWPVPPGEDPRGCTRTLIYNDGQVSNPSKTEYHHIRTVLRRF